MCSCSHVAVQGNSTSQRTVLAVKSKGRSRSPRRRSAQQTNQTLRMAIRVDVGISLFAKIIYTYEENNLAPALQILSIRLSIPVFWLFCFGVPFGIPLCSQCPLSKAVCTSLSCVDWRILRRSCLSV